MAQIELSTSEINYLAHALRERQTWKSKLADKGHIGPKKREQLLTSIERDRDLQKKLVDAKVNSR